FSLDRALEPFLPALLWVLEVTVHDAAWERLDPPQRRRLTLGGVKRLLLRESQVQPVGGGFEDLHWSLQRLHGRGGAQHRIEQLLRARRGQRIDAKLAVVALRPPSVLVLGSIVDEHHDARGRQALDQRIHEGLGLGVDPCSSDGPKGRRSSWRKACARSWR